MESPHMIPQNISSSRQLDPHTEEQLDCAAITVIAAWRNGHGFTSKEAQLLMPDHIPHPIARAMWIAICHYEAYPEAMRNPDSITRYAQTEVHASDEDWEVFWKRVLGACPVADEAAMRASARLLSEQYARVQKEKWSATPSLPPPNDGNSVMSHGSHARHLGEVPEAEGVGQPD